MKVILLTGEVPQVITVEDNEIIHTLDNVWSIWAETTYKERSLKILIAGNKVFDENGENGRVDYDATVTVTAFDALTDVTVYNCISPIIQDKFTDEFYGEFKYPVIDASTFYDYGYDPDNYDLEEMRALPNEIMEYLGYARKFADALRYCLGEPTEDVNEEED